MTEGLERAGGEKRSLRVADPASEGTVLSPPWQAPVRSTKSLRGLSQPDLHRRRFRGSVLLPALGEVAVPSGLLGAQVVLWVRQCPQAAVQGVVAAGGGSAPVHWSAGNPSHISIHARRQSHLPPFCVF